MGTNRLNKRVELCHSCHCYIHLGFNADSFVTAFCEDMLNLLGVKEGEPVARLWHTFNDASIQGMIGDMVNREMHDGRELD